VSATDGKLGETSTTFEGLAQMRWKS